MQTVKKSDYEIYTFNVPLSLHGKKRNAFITKELEKKHPCFSQECCFDSKLKFSNGKIQSIVAVMDRVKLREYRGKSKSGIFLDGVKNTKFFGAKRNLIFIGFLLAVFLLIYFFLLSINNSNIKELSATDNCIDEAETNVETEETKPTSYEVLEKVLSNISAGKGAVTVFNYALGDFLMDEDSVDISFSVKKMFPEDLLSPASVFFEREFKSLSPVSYEKSIPMFSVNYSLPVNNFQKGSDVGLVNMAKLRGVVKKYGTILSEDSTDSSFNVSIESNRFGEFFLEIGHIASELRIKPSRIGITVGKNIHNVVLNFFQSDLGNEQNELVLISKFQNLFLENAIPEITNTNVKRNRGIAKNQIKKVTEKTVAEEKNSMEEIGRVITKDGKSLVFYRDVNGKIKRVEK